MRIYTDEKGKGWLEYNMAQEVYHMNLPEIHDFVTFKYSITDKSGNYNLEEKFYLQIPSYAVIIP